MTTITLTLPYPISVNRYWMPVKMKNHLAILPTKEGREYRALTAASCRSQGVTAKITGRVHVDIKLYPKRPLDWQKRVKKDGAAWDDSVMCLDIDNANKVLLDSMKDLVIEDDKWIRRLTSERMEPDEHGARVVVTITALAVEQPQVSMFDEKPVPYPEDIVGVTLV
ncbi:RusA family crossover junction endodeoxyribonuclease [Herminiimonas sp. KBW02]|uniref:RusA family crossover junction endodeoxyribonuclease n=1 Tax=Herminiimonas sp. KBW02 TaxID=2153363 RepID=UPI000F5B6F25|nr:RusA family crossover junction endodeoxyribonuclease [Herminiimonas sp. KBW02]RQO38627.1 RusA family crossover junction endodeoxyribonuclease [Herminiimonas sp. KBW02]